MLNGAWVMREGRVVADEVCGQIAALTSVRLQKVAARDHGWIQLFQDPLDGSYWELSFPQGEMQGGGPPRLAELSLVLVRSAYPDLGV